MCHLTSRGGLGRGAPGNGEPSLTSRCRNVACLLVRWPFAQQPARVRTGWIWFTGAMDFVDPHFHLWDVASKEAGHDGPLIGGPAELHPQYTWQVSHRCTRFWAGVAPTLPHRHRRRSRGLELSPAAWLTVAPFARQPAASAVTGCTVSRAGICAAFPTLRGVTSSRIVGHRHCRATWPPAEPI